MSCFFQLKQFFFGVTYNKIKEKAKKMKKDVKKHADIKSTVMNTKKQREK